MRPLMFVARALSCFLFLSLAAPLVAAQGQLDPVLDLSASPGTLSLGPEGTAPITLTLANNGQTPGDVTLTMPTVAGWTFTPSTTGAITVPSGQSRTVTVTADAVPTDSTTPQSGPAEFSGTIRHATTGRGNTDRAPVALTYEVPAQPAPAPPPAEDNSWIGWLVGGLSALGLAGAGAGFFLMRSRSVGLGVAQQRKDIDRGTGDAYPVRVENKSRNTRTVQLRIAELPPRWVAAFSFPEVKLQPKEATTVPVYVRVPGDTPTGAVGRVRVQARSGPYTAWMASAELLTTVTDVRGERPNAFPEAAPKSVQGALDQLARST